MTERKIIADVMAVATFYKYLTGQDADFRTFRVWHSRRQDMDLSTDPLGASVYLERIQSCIVIDLRVRNFQSLEG